jgi:hypothetical protein
MLAREFGDRYTANPWLRFRDDAGLHWCQPDGILRGPDRVVIVEVKYNHTIEAWRQLRLLYEPVVGWLEELPISVVEVVKWYDCAVQFPEEVKLVKDVGVFTGREFGVHIFRP